MKNYIWLTLLFFFACKKEDEVTRIAIRQQPSVIALSMVDIVTGAELSVSSFQYFFNIQTSRFDSISILYTGVDTSIFTFDYTQLNTGNKILLNFRDSSTAYSELFFDNNSYALIAYRKYTPAQTTTGYSLQYDAFARLRRYDCSNALVNENYFRTYSYHDDTVLINSQRASDNCFSNDTLLSSSYELDYRIPHLFLSELGCTPSCGDASSALICALPLSNFIHKLPLKMLSGDTKTEYSYSGDQYGRLVTINIVKKASDTGLKLLHYKVSIAY
jgi:hypothetical protein